MSSWAGLAWMSILLAWPERAFPCSFLLSFVHANLFEGRPHEAQVSPNASFGRATCDGVRNALHAKGIESGPADLCIGIGSGVIILMVHVTTTRMRAVQP